MAYKPELWAEAKKKCRLNDEDIRMAKELGLNPKGLIKIFQIKMNSGSLRSKIGLEICMRRDSTNRAGNLMRMKY